MSSLNEIFGYEGKCSSLGMSTYSEQEAAMSLPYQLNLTVSAKVDNLGPKVERKLVSYMKIKLGYSECVIDKQNNTIYVYSIDGVTPSMILKYIKKNIDAGAR